MWTRAADGRRVAEQPLGGLAPRKTTRRRALDVALRDQRRPSRGTKFRIGPSVSRRSPYTRTPAWCGRPRASDRGPSEHVRRGAARRAASGRERREVLELRARPGARRAAPTRVLQHRAGKEARRALRDLVELRPRSARRSLLDGARGTSASRAPDDAERGEGEAERVRAQAAKRSRAASRGPRLLHPQRHRRVDARRAPRRHHARRDADERASRRARAPTIAPAQDRHRNQVRHVEARRAPSAAADAERERRRARRAR